ncbi:MAG: PspA/IM30 family protein [Chloroflexi bacterium]|nr:PspA/IM30 family protein [Chloroflexota bacterium]
MGLLSRMGTVLKAKMTAVLDRAEDPRETLDYSYQKQLELLQNVKRGVVEVVTSKRRLELQASKLRENVARLDEQARRALAAGREDLARTALERKQVALLELQGMASQISELENEQAKLTGAESRLAMKVEAFRTRKETIKAQYSAAEAQVRIGEAVTGVSEEMADVGLAIQRAEDKTEKMRARAGAIDELVAAGTLDDFTGRVDVVERELAQIAVSQNVDHELASLRRQLETSNPKQLKEGK